MRCARFAMLVLAALLPGALHAAASDAGLAARVREASLGLYVHGMTEEIALADVGREGAPELLALLADPAFPRRDNVVAFLAYLGGPDATRALLRHVAHPPAPLSVPE